MASAAGSNPPAFGNSFQAFLEYLSEPSKPVQTLSPQRFSAAMHLDLHVLAEQAHVHKATVTHAPGSRQVQAFLKESLRVIKAASDTRGNLNEVLFWYRNQPLSEFEYRTAERLVSEGRTDDLVRYVNSLVAGAAG